MPRTALTLAILLAGCRNVQSPSGSSRLGPADWMAWKAARLEAVAGPNGWTTLVLLHWLAEGSTSVGSDPINDAVVPTERAPKNIGVIKREGTTLRFEAAPGVYPAVNGAIVSSLEMKSDASGTPTHLKVGQLSMTVIERGDRLALRVRDPEAAARREFQGIETFPYQPEWRIEGQVEPYPEPRPVLLPDVTGGTQKYLSPGTVVFSHDRKLYRLEVMDEDDLDAYFVLFRDRTNGRTTYPAGRFLHIPHPKADGRVVIDFNRAYTPPCGFTPFATCPLAPDQNALPFSVRAGERAPTGVE